LDWGITLEMSSYNVVSNNVCDNSEEASGIALLSSSLRNTIQGNSCRDNDQYGITIAAGCNYNQVTNNYISVNDVGGLSDSGTGTITAAGNG